MWKDDSYYFAGIDPFPPFGMRAVHLYFSRHFYMYCFSVLNKSNIMNIFLMLMDNYLHAD